MMTSCDPYGGILRSLSFSPLVIGLFALLLIFGLSEVPPSQADGSGPLMTQVEDQNHHVHAGGIMTGQWEGSPEGMAYSHFNHALTGMGVILVGLSELRMALGWRVLAWSRWLLPVSLLASGIYVLIWSDHEAWPIGPWTLAETFSGKDPEVLQHKIFGILALGVGTVEWFLRSGKIQHLVWRAWLPGFAIVGSFLLFLHMHGPHPAGHQIQLHHNVMGALALAGGLAWFAGEWMVQSQPGIRAGTPERSTLKILWALFVVLIGVQLLFYSES